MSSDSNSIDYDNLGLVLRDLRKRKGLTQAQLAHLIGVKPQTIGKYETGLIKYPPLDKLQAIKDIIDDDNYILEFLMHDVSDTSQEAVDYTEDYAWAVSMPEKIETDFKEYLAKEQIDYGIPIRGNFFNKDIQKLVVAWDRASEKDKKAVSYILGFDYDPKPDDSNEK